MSGMSKAPHLYIATPAYACLVHTAYARALLQLQGECIKRGIHFSLDMIGNESLVQRARNILQARFLKSEATHLLFIDADIAFSPESVLDKLLPADKDVISGVYAKKNIDWDLVGKKLGARNSCRENTETAQESGLDYNLNVKPGTNQVADGVVEVLDTATGFLLIKRHVIEDMWTAYEKELWCKNDIQGTTQVDAYCAIFDCMIDPESRRYLSEDYAFCRRWQQMGGSIHAHIGFPLAHIGSHVFHGDLRGRFKLVYDGTV